VKVKGKMMKTEKQILAEIARLQAQLDSMKKPKMSKVRPLFSDKDIWIESDKVGGCCDPSTETYWSM
jgi:hypothetical protein